MRSEDICRPRHNPNVGPEVEIYKRKQGSKKKKRKHALDQEKMKVFRFKNINQFYFQPLIKASAISQFDQLEYF